MGFDMATGNVRILSGLSVSDRVFGRYSVLGLTGIRRGDTAERHKRGLST
jgi:hypothetical protein